MGNAGIGWQVPPLRINGCILLMKHWGKARSLSSLKKVTLVPKHWNKHIFVEDKLAFSSINIINKLKVNFQCVSEVVYCTMCHRGVGRCC